MLSVCRPNLLREYFAIPLGLVLVWTHEDYGLVWPLVHSGKGPSYRLHELKLCVAWACFAMAHDIQLLWLFGALPLSVTSGSRPHDVTPGGGYSTLRPIFLLTWIECVGDSVRWSSSHHALVALAGESYVRSTVLSPYWFDWWSFRSATACGASWQMVI